MSKIDRRPTIDTSGKNGTPDSLTHSSGGAVMLDSSEPPVFDAKIAKPQRYTCVRLIFKDGRTTGGIWTGREWWSEGRRVEPQLWQRFAPAQRAVVCQDDAFGSAEAQEG